MPFFTGYALLVPFHDIRRKVRTWRIRHQFSWFGFRLRLWNALNPYRGGPPHVVCSHCGSENVAHSDVSFNPNTMEVIDTGGSTWKELANGGGAVCHDCDGWDTGVPHSSHYLLCEPEHLDEVRDECFERGYR